MMVINMEFIENDNKFDMEFEGTQTINGKSAYEIAVENGYVGTEEEWLESLKGNDGHTPVKGEDYYTEADKTEMVQEVLNAMPSGGSVTAESIKSALGYTPADQSNVDALSKEIANLQTSGLTTAQVNALDGMFKKCAFTGDVTVEYTAFRQAFGIESGGTEEPDTPIEPEITLSSISAAYTGGDVTEGTALTSLTGITVTGTYSDGSTANITGYTLSGTIVEGTNTITVSYNGLTTTFTVVGIAESSGELPLFTGTDLLANHTFVENDRLPYGVITSTDITLPAGTYYLYSVYKTSSGINPMLYTFDGSVYTDVTSEYMTLTKTGSFPNGTYDEYHNEKNSTYQPNAAGYLVEYKMVLTKEYTGRIRLGAISSAYALKEPGWTILSTEQFNPYKQRLS